MIKIVLDTNVFVSALLKPGSVPDLVISLVLERQAHLCLSPAIAEEYEEVLAREKFKKLSQKKVKRLPSRLKAGAKWVEPKGHLDITRHDPEDNKFLECAQAAQADCLITGNIRHFPPRNFKKTLIVSPAEFLSIFAGSLSL